MPEVRPFKGIRYSGKRIKDLSRVVAPPYDIIPQKMQGELYRADEHNIVRLILNKIEDTDTAGDNRYTRSKAFFESWLKGGVLIQDKKPAIYIYSQIYKDGTKTINRTGFIALMALDMEGKTVLPHENTLAAPKVDRLDLMRSVKANLSPIFVLYDDKPHNILKLLKNFALKNKALIDVVFDDVRHRVWALDDERVIEEIERAMSKKDIFIADGHHRYEVARMYTRESPDARFMMAYFVESAEKTLTVLPTHRVVRDIGSLKKDDVPEKLKEAFVVAKVNALEPLITRMSKEKRPAFGMYLGNGAFYMLKAKRLRGLDVAILHSSIIGDILKINDSDENIEFVKDPKEAVKLADSGNHKLAFFLNPTKVEEVKRVAKRGERMPKKATYFYPKPLSGLVINKL